MGESFEVAGEYGDERLIILNIQRQNFHMGFLPL